MANRIIGATLEVTDKASGPIKDVNKAASDTNKTLKETNTTLQETQKTVSDSGENFSNLKKTMGALPGPLKDAHEGVSKLSEAFKAMLANPVVLVITAIVAALAFLYKSFTNTASGGEKMEQVFAGIKAAASAVLDAIFKLGGAIIKFFSGDFKGAFDDAKSAITGVVQAATDAYNQVSKLTAQAQQLRKEQAANDIDQAKRATELAKLREAATDPEVEVSKRKAALLELQKAAQEDAVKDLDLAKRVAENKIALLSIGTDAAKKNYAEIAQIRVEQLRGEADSANELRRIGKQITAANKQELAERKAAAAEAAAEAKKRKEELYAFNTQLNKLQQENEIALIKDGYEKEKAILENKIKDDKQALQKEYEDKKITRAQLLQLEAEELTKANNLRDQLEEKHKADVAKKEEEFQTKLNEIRTRTMLDGITDAREAEKVKLRIDHEQKIAQAIKDYKSDADKLFQIKTALDQEYDAEQNKLDEKNRKEDAKKQLEDAKALADAKQAIRDKEREQVDVATSAIANSFQALSDLAGKQTAVGKALAIASTTINTFKSAIAAFAGIVETIPGPVGIALGAIAAAGAIANGIATVKKIVEVQIPGQGASGSVPTAPSPINAPVAPTQTSTSLNQASINSVGQAVSGRAYVLDADVKNAQDRDARLSLAARLGG